MNREQHINALKELARQYDPENDVATPRVSITEMALIVIINDLIEQISDLEGAVERLENPVSDDYY